MLDTEDVVKRFGPMIRKIVNRSVRSPEDREDVYGHVVCTIHANRHAYDPAKGMESTWVFCVAERAVQEAYRKARRKFRRCPKAVPLDAVSALLAERSRRDVLGEMEGDAAELAGLCLSIPTAAAKLLWRDVLAAVRSLGWSKQRAMDARKSVQQHLSGRTA